MILIVDCGYKQVHLLEQIVDEYMDFKTVSIFDLETPIESAVKGIIISTSAVSIHSAITEKYLEKLAFIKSTDIPILCIGFAHQLLSLLYTGFSGHQPYINDLTQISCFEEDPIFDRLPLEINMMKNHADTVSIPPNFKLLASSDFAINEAMKHHQNPIYGIQFLPELSGNHGAIIIDNFIRIAQRLHPSS